jgi:hypothetical protein
VGEDGANLAKCSTLKVTLVKNKKMLMTTLPCKKRKKRMKKRKKKKEKRKKERRSILLFITFATTKANGLYTLHECTA